MLRTLSLGYFSTDITPSFSSRRKLSDLILYAKNNPTYREEEFNISWILNFCQSNQFSLVLPVQPDDRINISKEEAGKYWLEVLKGLNHFYKALSAKKDMKEAYDSTDPKKLARIHYSYKYHLYQAKEKENFLAAYVYLKDFFEAKVTDEFMGGCIRDFKNVIDEHFPWFSRFGTVAELYIGQLYFCMINVLLTKIASLQAQAHEFENWNERKKRLADINMGRIAVAEYINKARASLNEFETEVKANTDLLTFKCVLLNVTEIMAGPTPQAEIAHIRASLDAIEKVNNAQMKTGSNASFFGRDIDLGRMPVDNATKAVFLGRK